MPPRGSSRVQPQQCFWDSEGPTAEGRLWQGRGLVYVCVHAFIQVRGTELFYGFLQIFQKRGRLKTGLRSQPGCHPQFRWGYGSIGLSPRGEDDWEEGVGGWADERNGGTFLSDVGKEIVQAWAMEAARGTSRVKDPWVTAGNGEGAR